MIKKVLQGTLYAIAFTAIVIAMFLLGASDLTTFGYHVVYGCVCVAGAGIGLGTLFD